MTMHWPNRVFCFLLAMTMVNVQNAATYFLKKPKLDSLQARCLIAKAVINNVHLQTGTTPRECENAVPSSMSLPWSHLTKNLFKGDSPIAR